MSSSLRLSDRPRHRFRRRGAVLAAAMTVVATVAFAPIASAATITGSASGSSWSSITWEEGECYNGTCVAAGFKWSSTSDGQNYWQTTYQHSEGQTYWTVAPFEQDVDLQNGTQLYGEGVFPIAGTHSNIYNASGQLLYSNYQAGTRGRYWAVIQNPSWIYWAMYSTAGFNIYTSTYPPGTDSAYYIISPNDGNIAGGWSDTYSGSLR